MQAQWTPCCVRALDIAAENRNSYQDDGIAVQQGNLETTLEAVSKIWRSKISKDANLH